MIPQEEQRTSRWWGIFLCTAFWAGVFSLGMVLSVGMERWTAAFVCGVFASFFVLSWDLEVLARKKDLCVRCMIEAEAKHEAD